MPDAKALKDYISQLKFVVDSSESTLNFDFKTATYSQTRALYSMVIALSNFIVDWYEEEHSSK